jgi:Tol biopolymer transport system component
MGGASQPSWAPDGKSLAFVEPIAGLVVTAPFTAAGLGATTTVAQWMPGSMAFGHPSFAPDGKSVVVDHAYDIESFPVGGGMATFIVEAGSNAVETPSISPTGDKIAVAMNCNGESIWLLPYPAVPVAPCVAGTRLTAMSAGTINHPAFGPSGLFAAVSGEMNGHIVVFVSGSDVYPLTNGSSDDRNPTWAPENTHFP